MKPKLYFFKSLILIALLYFFLPIKLTAQNWLPLEVGNRWDFFLYGYCHGGSTIEDTLLVEVVGDTVLNGKEYHVLTSPFYLFQDKFLRVENDSLYCFNSEDSVDCSLYAFNQPPGAKYYSCRYDSVFFDGELYEIYFGYPDSNRFIFPMNC